MDGKNGTVESVRRTQKLRCYSNMPNRGRVIFACLESTLAVHSENPFMVSNLTIITTENVTQIPYVAKTEFLDLVLKNCVLSQCL